MANELPLHIQVLLALRKQVEARKHQHEAKCGRGLEDREYQRHVGRIAECDVQITAITEMMRADSDDVADALEEEERDERSQHGTSGARRHSRAGGGGRGTRNNGNG